jgi:hypothetical protein
VFGAKQYAPWTRVGQHLLAHELTHVLQQHGRPEPLATKSLGNQANTMDKRTANTAAATTMLGQEASTVSPLGAGVHIQRQAASSEVAPAVSSEAEDYRNLSEALREQINVIETNLNGISNRSLLFTLDIDLMHQAIDLLTRIRKEGDDLVAAAEMSTGTQRSASFEKASARYEAVLILTQLSHLLVNFYIVADLAETAGLPGGHLEEIFSSLGKDTRSISRSVVGFDRQKMAQAASQAIGTVQRHVEFLEKWAKSIEGGIPLSRRAVAAANYITIIFSLYTAGRAIAASRGGPPAATFRLPTIVGVTAGGTAVGAQIVVSAEMLESIRQLIRIGAISGAVASFSGGTISAVPQPVVPAVLFRATPSGTVTPTSGSHAGQRVTYGDPRHKHTKVADHTLAEMEEALRNPPKRGPLARFVQAVKNKDKTYGGQLSKEATDRYEELVRDGLNLGKERAGKSYHTASYNIGIDIETGRATPLYRLDGAPNGAHIIPISEIP